MRGNNNDYETNSINPSIANNIKNPHLKQNNAGFVVNQPRTTQQEVMMKITEIAKLNKQAMQNFKLGEKDPALRMLMNAEKLCESLKQYWYFKQKELGDMLSNNTVCKAFTTTYNNLGVFHKQSGKTNLAIKYLKQVLEIEQEMNNADNQEQEIASTFVNICSIYSEMGKHDIALTYIKRAVDYLDEAYEHKLHSIIDIKEKRQFIQIVATAFHNAGVEYEFLKNFERCLQYYQKSFGICLQHLGSEHPLSQTFEKSLIGAQRKIDTMTYKIILPTQRKKTKSQNIKGGGTKTQRSDTVQQKLKKINQDISLVSLSPMSMHAHHKGEVYLNRNQGNKSQSQIKRPLPYISQDPRYSNNSNLEIRNLAKNLKNQNFMSERNISRSNQGVYNKDDAGSKDRQEYFSIRDLLEQSRNEIKDEIQQYNSSQLINKAYQIDFPQSNRAQNANNLKNIYKTISQPERQESIRNKQKRGNTNNTLNLMQQNNPDLKSKRKNQQNITLDYFDTNNSNRNQNIQKKPPRPLKLNDDLIAYLPKSQQTKNINKSAITTSNQQYLDIQNIVAENDLNTIVDKDQIKRKRMENIQAINRNKLKSLQDKIGINNNLQIKSQRKQSDITGEIGNVEQGGQEELNKSKRYEIFEDKLRTLSNHEKKFDRKGGNGDQLESMINNLKKDLDLSYQHPRSPSNFISKTDYIKELDPTTIKSLRNAAITQKTLIIKDKVKLIRKQDQLLQLIESKKNSPDVQKNKSIKGLIEETSLLQESMRKQNNYDSCVDNNQILRDSTDYSQPIVLSDARDEIEQMTMINSRARRQKVMEQLKSNNTKPQNTSQQQYFIQPQIQQQQQINPGYLIQHNRDKNQV
eukprot:403377098